MTTVKHRLQVSGSRLKNDVLIAQTWNITYEEVAAFGLVEWFDDLFMEALVDKITSLWGQYILGALTLS